MASACVAPVVVQAETVYEPEEVTIPKEGQPVHQPKTHPPHGSSGGESKEGPEAEMSGTPGGGEGSGGTGNTSSGIGSSNGGSPGTDNGKGAGQGNPGNGPKLAESKPVKSSAAGAEESGSSSPLVPILIAIAVLAAISIGAVVVRQRRQRDGSGSQVSPRAS
jgi:hypothetical protein